MLGLASFPEERKGGNKLRCASRTVYISSTNALPCRGQGLLGGKRSVQNFRRPLERRKNGRVNRHGAAHRGPDPPKKTPHARNAAAGGVVHVAEAGSHAPGRGVETVRRSLSPRFNGFLFTRFGETGEGA